MPRIMAIDYGSKRTGLAVTDPLQIIASGLTTVPTETLMKFLEDYLTRESVELILVGEPKNLDDSDTDATKGARNLMGRLKKKFPLLSIEAVDERFSSKMASRAMINMGMKKKDRRNKALIDEIAATLLLQEYLQFRNGG